MRSLLPLLAFALDLTASAADPGWVSDAVVQQARRAAVTVDLDEGFYVVGFFATADGMVVTSASSLEMSSYVKVMTSEGKVLRGNRLMLVDAEADIAVIATDEKAPGHLPPDIRPAKAGEMCALVYHDLNTEAFKVVDGKLLARRECMHTNSMRMVDCWSVAFNPTVNPHAGAPIVTAEGRVAGIINYPDSRRDRGNYMATPEAVIASALTRAAAASKPVEPPKPGTISDMTSRWRKDYHRGAQLASAGDDANAAQAFRSALKQDPQCVTIMCALAYTLINVEQLDEARQLLEDAHRLAPKSAKPSRLLALLHHRTGNYGQAAEGWKKIVAEFPTFGDAWINLGGSLFEAGSHREGLECIRKGIELEPDSLFGWKACANAFGKMSDANSISEMSKANSRINELEKLMFRLQYSAPKRN